MRFAFLRLTGPVLALLTIVMAAICVLPFFAAARIDDESIRREQMLVKRNIVLWSNELENEIQRYATWDVAMDRLGGEVDVDWVRENVLSPLFRRTAHRFAAILDGDNRLVLDEVRELDGGDALYRHDRDEIVAEAVRLTRSARIFEASRRSGHDPANLADSRILMLDGKAVLVTATIFQNESRVSLPEGFRSPVLVVATPIEASLVETFSNRLYLSNAVMEWRPRGGPIEDQGGTLASAWIADDKNATLYLTWMPFRHGHSLLQRAMPLMVAGILAFLVGGICLFNVNRRATAALMRSEAQLRHAASHDVLTGLHNRRTFETTLEEMSRRGPLTLVCLDLDGFKPINDRFGHGAGDAVLCEVAHRLKGHRRQEDASFRLGGDEFALLMPGIVGPEARALCQRLAALLSIPIAIAEGQVAIGASMGLATVDGPASLRTALVRADAALYRAKARRKAGDVAADTVQVEEQAAA